MRDDFSLKVKDTLAKRVAYRCSNPACCLLTSGPRTEPDRALSIGVAAHIAAASPGGPRYNASQTKEQRTSIINAIWLCQNCAKLIDSDEVAYPTQLLLHWKWQAEDVARKALGSSASRPKRDNQVEVVLQSCVQRGVIVILGRAMDLALDHSLLQNLDNIAEGTLQASLRGRGKRSSLPYRRSVPDLSAILNGVVTEKDYYAVREKLYRTIDRSKELRELARSYVENLPFPILTNITRQITSLIAAGAVKGVVQLNPIEAIEQRIRMSTRCDPNYYRNGVQVSAEPFVLNLGLDTLTLPVFHLRTSDISSTLGPYLKQCHKPRPVILGINISPMDSEMLLNLSALPEARTDIFVIGGPDNLHAPQIVSLSISPVEFISKLDAVVTPQASLFRFCRTIDFHGAPSITRIVNSEKLQPNDAKIVMVPYEFENDLGILKKLRRIPIGGLAGTGKSTRAFLLCYEMFRCSHPVYFLPLSELHGDQVDLNSITELLADLTSLHPDTVLLIDDMHLFPELFHNLNRWLDEIEDVRRPYVIFVQTYDYAFQDLVGGQILPLKEDGGKDESARIWKENLRRLTLWVQQKSHLLAEEQIFISPEALERCENSQNPWHFFYLLRGGYQGLIASVSAARVRNRADIVWFGLSLLYAVGKERPYVMWEVLEVIQKHNLVPPHIPPHLAHIWVSESVHALLSSRLIVSEGEGMVPRHKLEAAMLVRSMTGAEHSMLEACQFALLGMLSEHTPPISLPPSCVDALLHGDKVQVKEVIYTRVRPTVDSIVARQVTLVRFPQLQDFFSAVWREFIEAITPADIHHLYWIVTAIPEFAMNAFVYSPFEYCNALKGLNSLRITSEGVDLSIVLKSMVGEDSLRQIECVYRMRLLRLEELGLRQAVNDYLNNNPRLSKKEKRRMRAQLNTLTALIESEMEKLAEEGEQREELLPKTGTDDDLERLVAEHTCALLQAIENRRNCVAHVASLVDPASVVKFMREVNTEAGFLILASLWQVSPEAAGRLYDSLGATQRRKLERSVIDCDSCSEFHMNRDSILFHLFVRWLGTKNKRIAIYYEKFCADGFNSEFRESVNQAEQKLSLQGGSWVSGITLK